MLANLAYFRALRGGGHYLKLKIGITFGALNRNIAELPDELRIGQQLRRRAQAMPAGGGLYGKVISPAAGHSKGWLKYDQNMMGLVPGKLVDLPRTDLSLVSNLKLASLRLDLFGRIQHHHRAVYGSQDMAGILRKALVLRCLHKIDNMILVRKLLRA